MVTGDPGMVRDDHSPRPTAGRIDGATRAQTPSRAEHGLEGVLLFTFVRAWAISLEEEGPRNEIYGRRGYWPAVRIGRRDDGNSTKQRLC